MPKSWIPKDAILIPKQAVRVFKGEIYDVYHWPQKRYDGSIRTYEMLKRPNTVIIIPVIDQQLVYLQEEQPNIRSHLSFPGGRQDKQENPLEAAQRELQEETGYIFSKYKLVSITQPMGHIERFVYYFIASNLVKKLQPNHDAGEKITILKDNYEVVKKLAQQHQWLCPEILDKTTNTKELLNLPEYNIK